MSSKWFSFKMISSVLLLVMVTWNALCYDDWAVWGDIWLCLWCICIVRFVDVIDEIGGEYDKD